MRFARVRHRPAGKDVPVGGSSAFDCTSAQCLFIGNARPRLFSLHRNTRPPKQPRREGRARTFSSPDRGERRSPPLRTECDGSVPPRCDPRVERAGAAPGSPERCGEVRARVSLADAIEQFEKDSIVDALKSARGNRAKAARLLGTTERIIGYKIRKYDIEVARFRGAPSLSAARRRTGTRWSRVSWWRLTPSGPIIDPTPSAVLLRQCDPFGIPSTSHWTGAAIIVQGSRTKNCIVTGPRTSPRPMPCSLAG